MKIVEKFKDAAIYFAYNKISYKHIKAAFGAAAAASTGVGLACVYGVGVGVGKVISAFHNRDSWELLEGGVITYVSAQTGLVAAGCALGTGLAALEL